MEIYLKTRDEWREWLEKNHTTAEEIWLRYYKKPSGKPRIPYIDAVEEALCFGWIDGKIKRINEDYFIQRFTPRRPGSRWSKYNIERIQKLIKEGRMKQSGLEAYRQALEKPALIYYNRSDGDPEIPGDLKKEIGKNKTATENFMNFSQSARRIYIEWLNSAKKPETRPRRIAKIVEFAEKNLKPGMM
ncbi:MAG: YdeI/OmpD-associated family protein [Bacteroidales bacterium]|nr:YdeI/OmpD-associated family protein [Bacteroidales bacterium]